MCPRHGVSGFSSVLDSQIFIFMLDGEFLPSHSHSDGHLYAMAISYNWLWNYGIIHSINGVTVSTYNIL